MRVNASPAVTHVILCAAAILSLFPVQTHGITNHYVEDFSTKEYCDTLNTTAWWDTIAGGLKLFPFELTLAMSYDIPGSAMGIAVSGNHAFVAVDTWGLAVIDISNPKLPSMLGVCDTPGNAWNVSVTGDYAFVADYYYGLQIIDISDTHNPILVGSYVYADRAFSVTIAGDYAFVAYGESGLLIFDISDPTNPTFVGLYDTPVLAIGVAVSGDYAFVADYTAGLQVIDISDPTNPTLLGSCDTPDQAWDVKISGDYAFVADYASGLQVIDISNPTNPFIIGSYDTQDWARCVTISGDYAYVADGTTGMLVIDISDPTNPTLHDSCDTPGTAWCVAVSPDYAFVADFTAGLQVIDVLNRMNPTLFGSYDTPGEAWGVAISGDYSFIADHTSGLQVVDISDPTNPTLTGTYNTPGVAFDVTTSGDYAFVADDVSGLHVFDITDPTNLMLLGTYNTPGNARGIAVSGDYAFVADYNSGLLVIDVSDPTTPTLLGSCYGPPYLAYDVTVSGDYAFVGDINPPTSGLYVIDISDPTNPTIAGFCSTPGSVYCVEVSGDYAYVTNDTYGFRSIDISDPMNPTYVGGCDIPGFAYRVTIAGDYAFVTADTYGVHVIGISFPASPWIIYSYDTPGNAWGVEVSGDYAFVTDRTSGFHTIQVFQRDFILDDNVGSSLFVDASNDTILSTRLATAQTATVTWELSADGGGNWQVIAPDGCWNQLAVPGTDLVWRSTHALANPNVNPTVTQLEIDWLFQFAAIDSIWDVPNDQGRQVRIEWQRSGHDYTGSPTPIIEYAVYRKIDYALTALQGSINPPDMVSDVIYSENIRPEAIAYPPGNWDFITTVPADCEESYSVVVPTLADSTIDEGMYYSTFFVRVRTATPGVYYDSPVDSGYSVDNLAPGVPTGLMVAYNTDDGNELTWDECSDTDFQYFCVYRDTEDDFDPSPGNLVHMTASPTWTDPVDDGWQYTYKITAVDCNGNESEAASAATVTGDETQSVPTAFALHQNVPNPFNPSTRIRFDLPRAAHVRLTIYDVSGRLVRTLVDAEMEPGSRDILWDGRDDAGRETASGIYFYRLVAGDFVQTKKMVLLR